MPSPLPFGASVVVLYAEQVADLPWAGNFHDDAPLFSAVTEFICARALTRGAASRALFLMSSLGYGFDGPVSDSALDQFVAEDGRVPLFV